MTGQVVQLATIDPNTGKVMASQLPSGGGGSATFPAGGTTLSALVKASNADNDVTWHAFTAGDVGAAAVSALAAVAFSGLATDLDLTGFSTPSNLLVTQNSDGTWPARPAGAVRFWMSNPGAATSSIPGSNGSTSGGGGMVQGADLLFMLPA